MRKEKQKPARNIVNARPDLVIDTRQRQKNAKQINHMATEDSQSSIETTIDSYDTSLMTPTYSSVQDLFQMLKKSACETAFNPKDSDLQSRIDDTFAAWLGCDHLSYYRKQEQYRCVKSNFESRLKYNLKQRKTQESNQAYEKIIPIPPLVGLNPALSIREQLNILQAEEVISLLLSIEILDYSEMAGSVNNSRFLIRIVGKKLDRLLGYYRKLTIRKWFE